MRHCFTCSCLQAFCREPGSHCIITAERWSWKSIAAKEYIAIHLEKKASRDMSSGWRVKWTPRPKGSCDCRALCHSSGCIAGQVGFLCVLALAKITTSTCSPTAASVRSLTASRRLGPPSHHQNCLGVSSGCRATSGHCRGS